MLHDILRAYPFLCDVTQVRYTPPFFQPLNFNHAQNISSFSIFSALTLYPWTPPPPTGLLRHSWAVWQQLPDYKLVPINFRATATVPEDSSISHYSTGFVGRLLKGGFL